MHAAEDPAERSVGDEAEAIVGLTGAGYVGAGEGDSGDDLNKKSRERGAAENVKPSRFSGLRDWVCKRRAERLRTSGDVVEPGPETLEGTHHDFLIQW